MTPAQDLAHGAEQLGIDLPPGAQQKLVHYLELLQKWNKVYNLTAIRQPKQMVSHHLLDSLAVVPHLWRGQWLDVGCGPGLPGLVMAMARPDWQITLLDSNGKKTSFVQQAIIELGLANARVFQARAEEWQPAERFDGIISRAFAEASDFIAVTRRLLKPQGCWVAMKGRPEDELKGLPHDVGIDRIIPLEVPGLDAARCLVILREN
jgi:16S rRNA (guanine527-N7)-methyltransferase